MLSTSRSIGFQTLSSHSSCAESEAVALLAKAMCFVVTLTVPDVSLPDGTCARATEPLERAVFLRPPGDTPTFVEPDDGWFARNRKTPVLTDSVSLWPRAGADPEADEHAIFEFRTCNKNNTPTIWCYLLLLCAIEFFLVPVLRRIITEVTTETKIAAWRPVGPYVAVLHVMF